MVHLGFILEKVAKMLFYNNFRYFLFWNRCKMLKIAKFLRKKLTDMRETPRETHMHDMVKIDAIFFEIVRGGGFKNGSLTVSNAPDRMGFNRSIEFHLHGYTFYLTTLWYLKKLVIHVLSLHSLHITYLSSNICYIIIFITVY